MKTKKHLQKEFETSLKLYLINGNKVYKTLSEKMQKELKEVEE